MLLESSTGGHGASKSSRDPKTVDADLTETFTNLRKYKMKLNPSKCVFGVPAGKLLGFIVSDTDMSQRDKHKSLKAHWHKCKTASRQNKVLQHQ